MARRRVASRQIKDLAGLVSNFGARHARSPQQRIRRVDERAASAGQARRPRLPHSQELHRHRQPAPVTLEEPAGSPVQHRSDRRMRLSRSTRNGIEPLRPGFGQPRIGALLLRKTLWRPLSKTSSGPRLTIRRLLSQPMTAQCVTCRRPWVKGCV